MVVKFLGGNPMRKGQGNVITAIAVIPIAVISLLIGFWVYGSVSDIVPHDKNYRNETLCTSCSLQTSYEFDHYPILNGSSLTCTNNTGALVLTNGVANPTGCNGYNIVDHRYLNLTNATSTDCTFLNVKCDYTHDEANANEQGFYDSSTASINSSFTLGSVAPVIFAAVIIIGAVLLFGRKQ